MTIEAAFDGEHIRVAVNGHRLRLLYFAAALLAPVAVVVDYRWSQRRGLR